jgi:hypothetical protein
MVLYHVYDLQNFLPFCGLSLHFLVGVCHDLNDVSQNLSANILISEILLIVFRIGTHGK